MSKLQELKIPLTPTSVEGIYMRDLSIDDIRSLQKELAGGEGDDNVLWLFQKVFCDENGDPIEDAGSIDEINKIGAMTLKKITDDAANFFSSIKSTSKVSKRSKAG